MVETPKEGLLEVKFDIIQPANRPILVASGAFGGVSAAGQIVAHLYAEYPDIPKTASLKIDPATNSHSEIPLVTRRLHYIREVVGTLVMTPEVALALSDWCKQQADAANSLTSLTKKA